MYIGSMFIMKKQINAGQLFSTAYLPATIIVVSAAWSPPFIYDQFKKWADPSLEQKIMSQDNTIIRQ